MGAATSGSFEGVRTAAVDGVALAYREQGEGEAVVLVHGSASDLRTWERQLPAIGTRYRAIAYSRRYARPNEDIEPGADDQMLPHVDDLAALLRLIGAAPAHLLGHSWGAFICLLAAIRHPEMVRSLVLQEPPVLSLFASTPPLPRELFPLLVRRPRTALAILEFGAGTIAPAQRAFRRGDDDQALQAFAHGALGKKTYERLPEERKQQARENLGTLRAQLLGAGFPPLDEEDVRGIRVPTLLMTGQRSPAVLLRLTEYLQRLLPHAERVGRLARDAGGEPGRCQRGDPRLPRSTRIAKKRALAPAPISPTRVSIAASSRIALEAVGSSHVTWRGRIRRAAAGPRHGRSGTAVRRPPTLSLRLGNAEAYESAVPLLGDRPTEAAQRGISHARSWRIGMEETTIPHVVVDAEADPETNLVRATDFWLN